MHVIFSLAEKVNLHVHVCDLTEPQWLHYIHVLNSYIYIYVYITMVQFTAITILQCISYMQCGYDHAGTPSPPSNVVAVPQDFQNETFSIKLSWDRQNNAMIDAYKISVNNNVACVGQNMSMHIIEGNYNNNITIEISATT